MAKVTTDLTKAEMELPDFHFLEVEELYIHDLSIPDDLYQSLLHKERKLIIEDLEKVLAHAIDKFETFNAKNVPDKNTFFVWHTVLLLADLKATESIDAVLNFLKQDEELVGFYLGDGIWDFQWEILYTLGKNNIRLLVDLCKNLPDSYYLRTEIIEALKQVFLHAPERKLEIESYLRELLLYASTVSAEDDLYIDEMSDKLLETIGELRLTAIFPEIKRLLDEDKLPLTVQTGWKHFERQYVSKIVDPTEIIQQPRSAKEIYTVYLEAQAEQDEDGEYDDDDDSYEDFEDYLDEVDSDYEDSIVDDDKNKSYIDYEESHTPFVKKEPDIGRNDPCPCGSGKKYKKCHGKS